MDTKKFFEWLKTLPVWLRAIVLAILAALVLIASMSTSACGTTRAIVKNSATGTTTEIRITTNNPTSVETTPNISLSQPN